MAISSVLAFWAVAAVLIVVPGPDWAFAISAGLRGQVVPAASGIVLGYLALTVVVAAGLGGVVVATPAALMALTIAGGIYLTWLGAKTITHPAAASAAAENSTSTGRSTALQGVAVSGLNPKGLLVFVAMLPQFTNPDERWPVAGQMTILGLVFTLSCAIVYLCVGACARSLLQARSSTARVVSRVSGVSMILIGLLLLGERLAAR
jgi:threonine/homoserine/homoserine lactone efflux protein